MTFDFALMLQLQWFSSGTEFNEYAEGGHYRMTKSDKRENIIMIASEPLTFERGKRQSCYAIRNLPSYLDRN